MEKSQRSKLEMPSEVLRIIGTENLLKLSPMAYNSALASLDKMLKTKGLDWIKENREDLVRMMDIELGML